MTRRIKKSKVKDLRDLKKKSISPIISVVLLLVIAVIIVGSILSFGLSTTNSSLDKSQEIYKEDKTLSGYIYTSNTQPSNYVVKNLSKKDLEIVKYEIIAPQDSDILNRPITLDQPINLNSGSMVSIPLICNPDKSFKVNLITSDGRYITVPINNINYQSNSCFNNSEIPDPVCLGIIENGTGNSNNDQIIICDADDLNNVRNELNKYYKLGKDIDLNVSPYNEGEGWEPIGNDKTPFSKSFDGDNHIIRNLYINKPQTDYIGLFGYAKHAEIKNLNLKDVNISGNLNVGGLLGYLETITIDKMSIISNSSVTGKIVGNSIVGGLVAQNNNSIIYRNYVVASISGIKDVGGLIGNSDGFSVQDNYSFGDVNGSMNVGGLIGVNNKQISSNYSGSLVIGESAVGGLVGTNNKVGVVEHSFYDINKSGQSDNDGRGTPFTTEELKIQSTFEGWDFISIWAIDAGSTYPYLRSITYDESNPKPT